MATEINSIFFKILTFSFSAVLPKTVGIHLGTISLPALHGTGPDWQVFRHKAFWVRLVSLFGV